MAIVDELYHPPWYWPWYYVCTYKEIASHPGCQLSNRISFALYFGGLCGLVGALFTIVFSRINEMKERILELDRTSRTREVSCVLGNRIREHHRLKEIRNSWNDRIETPVDAHLGAPKPIVSLVQEYAKYH